MLYIGSKQWCESNEAESKNIRVVNSNTRSVYCLYLLHCLMSVFIRLYNGKVVDIDPMIIVTNQFASDSSTKNITMDIYRANLPFNQSVSFVSSISFQLYVISQ